MMNTAIASQPYQMRLEGDFDALAVEQLRNQFDTAAEQQQDVILDMQAVEFIDSSGIGAIVFLFKRLRSNNHSLSICGVKGQPLELMQYLRIDKCISLDTADDA